MISIAPDSRASALAPDAGSISGLLTAKAAPDIPRARSVIPIIFINLLAIPV